MSDTLKMTIPTSVRRSSWRMPLSLALGSLLFACGEQGQEPQAGQSASAPAQAPSQQTESAGGMPAVVQTGVFFAPDLTGYELYDEYDDDGDGDGIKETHVRRYHNERGDSAFSLATHDTLWAWSLDTKGDDDADIHSNYVVRDSNCDNVFDERYGLAAEFHVPSCAEASTP
jgi:hypothetical protein